MKLNIIKVLNNIANEEATVSLLNDPYAFWNITSEIELKHEYENYKEQLKWSNDSAWEMIEWLDKNGYDYSHWKIEKELTFDEWLAKEMEIRSKYLVAA